MAATAVVVVALASGCGQGSVAHVKGSPPTTLSATAPDAAAASTPPTPLAAAPAGIALPDPVLTPGATFPGATTVTVCAPGYATAFRSLTTQEASQVFRRYGLADVPGRYEVDHLIPLELGGSNDQTNLWPEPLAGTYGAREKDRVEDGLHTLVCSGKTSLADAQRYVREWWVFIDAEAAKHPPAAAAPPAAAPPPAGGPSATTSPADMSPAAMPPGSRPSATTSPASAPPASGPSPVPAGPPPTAPTGPANGSPGGPAATPAPTTAAPTASCSAHMSDPAPGDGGSDTAVITSDVPSSRVVVIAHYKTTNSEHDGASDASGSASVTFGIGRPTRGYPVQVDVTVGGRASCSTSFTPQ